jgi:xanthine dehydrogenase accessory factor
VKEMPPHTFFLSLTQGHSVDTPILEEIFRSHPEAKYIGVIGSELKGVKIRQELLARGIAPSLLEKLRCPMGLDLGKNHPGEIAVSIVAELLQTRDR